MTYWKVLACTALMILHLPVVAQQDATPKTPRQKQERQDQLVVDLMYERFVNRPRDVNFKWYNNGINVQLFFDQPLGRSHFSTAIGLGISSQSYYSDAQVRRDTTSSTLYSDWESVADVDYRNNKISSTYVEIPFEFRWRSDEDSRGHRWKAAMGVKVGYLLDVHDKIRMQNRDKFKTYIFPDHQDYRISGLVRVGYGKVNFVANYGITPWFRENRGPSMNQLSIGISILPF